MGGRQGKLAVDPRLVAQGLYVGNFRLARPERRLNEEPRCGVGVGVVVGPCRGRWRRIERPGPVCWYEVAVNFAGRVIDGVNVDVGFTFLDDLDDIGRRQSPNRRDVPHVAAIGLWCRDINIEHDLAWIAQVRIAMNMFSGFG